MMDTYVFKTVNGHEIKADIYRAPRAANTQQPAVMFIHGGGLILGNRKAILPSHIQAFHDSGFHVVSIDYRLAPETTLPEIVSDISDAWAWLREQASSFGIDRNRVAILGHSAGAYLALMSGYKLNPRPAALVSIAGYGRLTSDEFIAPSPHYVTEHRPVDEHDARQTVGGGTISASGPNDSIQRFLGRGLFYLFCRQTGIWLNEVSGHDSHDHDWFAQYQPFSNVSAEYPPTMLLHGEPDTDVLIEESVLMEQELIRHGVAHTFVRNPNWGHAFLYMPNDESVSHAFGQIVTFLQQHA